MKGRYLLTAICIAIAGLIVALASHSVASGAPLRITPTPSPRPTSTITYVVQRGDTLFAISRRFGVPVLDIARANRIINPSLIFVGQVLVIPTPGSGSPSVTPTPTPRPGGVTTYVVQRGDTLYRIAIRFGTSINAIRVANNLANINLIYVGQTLIIPSGTTAPTPTPAPTTTPPPFPTSTAATVTLTPPPPTPTATPLPYPTPSVTDVQAAYQPFERGFMIWLGDRRRIWVAVCCTSTIPMGGRWLSFDDSWFAGMPESDPSIVPPNGLYQPVRGFGLVWRTLSDPGSGGSIRDLLGWATAPEQGYTAHLVYMPGGFFDPGGGWNARPGTWTIDTPIGKRYYFHEAGPAWSQAEP